ncbi:AAA family ATPase [Microlunatus sp. GCM10028923]|uniref:AAA family ATPase n=1 Tax=Microlunatus sp. GCM10028923 TaxID=3273400 RepID=UPI00360F2814
MSQRDEVTAEVEAHLRSPLPGIVMITGPRGVGRTTFLETVHRRLADEVDAVLVPARPGREPYQSARAMVGALGPDPVLDPLRAALAPAVPLRPGRSGVPPNEFERRTGRTPLLIMDDLQILDPASRSLVRRTLDRASAAGWRVLAAEADPLLPAPAAGVPDDEVPADEVRPARTVRLEPWTPAEARTALRRRTGVDLPRRQVDWLYRLSGGLPGLLFGFAAELDRAALQGAAPPPVVPAGRDPYLAEVLGPGLYGLGPRHRRSLALFAHHDAVPLEFRFDRPDWPEPPELADAGLVTLTDAGWSPALPAAAVLAWQLLRYGERAELCRVAHAGWLELDPGEALYYGCQLTDPAAADPKAVLDEVEAMVGRGQYEAGYRLASTWWASGHGGDTGELVVLLAELALQLGYPDLAAPLIERRHGIADHAVRSSLAAVGVEAVVVRDRTWDGLLADLRPSHGGEPDDPGIRLRTIRAAHSLADRGATDEARSILHGMDQAGLPEPYRLLLELTRTRLAVLADEEGAAERLHALLVRWVDRGAPGPWSFSATGVTDLLALGDPRTARTLADLALADPARQSPISRNAHAVALVSVELAEGAHLRAAERLTELRTEISSDRPWVTVSALDQVIGAALGLEASPGLPVHPRLLRTTAAESSGYDADIGRATLIRGRPAAAAARLAAALRHGRLLRQGPASVLADLVEAQVGAGDLSAARRSLVQFRSRLYDAGTDTGRAVLARADALVAEDAVADARFRDALDACGEDVPELELARTMIAYGSRLARTDRSWEAETLHDQAAELLRAGSFAGWLAHLDRLRGQAVPSHWSQTLSRTQRTLVTLIADGGTYGELAERLFVSRRTAARRVNELYQDLGVAGRSELVALVRSDPPDWLTG